MRILVGEEHPLAGVMASGQASGAAIRCEVVPAEELLYLAVAAGADAVVLDAATPLDRPLDVLVPAAVGTHTLVLCLHHGSEPLGSQAIEATACAFFLASADAAEVAHVVAVEHARLCGHTQPARAAGLAATRTCPSTLSAREKTVLTLLAQEKTSREIAGALGVSPRTVDATRSALMKKLGVQSTVGLACYAVAVGLVGP